MTNNTERGFTITELMLAMTFVAFLLIFSVTIIVQMTQIYNKGLTIRQINQTGRQINEDMVRSLRYASSGSIKTWKASPTDAVSRLCTGQTSYVWNLDEPDLSSQPNKYAPTNDTAIRLIRVNDVSGALCEGAAIDKADSREMLTGNLQVKCLVPTIPALGANKLITINAIIASSGDNSPVLIPPTADTYNCGSTAYGCPAGLDGAFCAIGQFKNIVYVRN